MSALIKGMKIPADGIISDQYGHPLIIKAVHVPPHGRLSDLDKNAQTIISAEEVIKKDGGQDK